VLHCRWLKLPRSGDNATAAASCEVELGQHAPVNKVCSVSFFTLAQTTPGAHFENEQGWINSFALLPGLLPVGRDDERASYLRPEVGLECCVHGILAAVGEGDIHLCSALPYFIARAGPVRASWWLVFHVPLSESGHLQLGPARALAFPWLPNTASPRGSRVAPLIFAPCSVYSET
jgi:hypothetical protein